MKKRLMKKRGIEKHSMVHILTSEKLCEELEIAISVSRHDVFLIDLHGYWETTQRCIEKRMPGVDMRVYLVMVASRFERSSKYIRFDREKAVINEAFLKVAATMPVSQDMLFDEEMQEMFFGRVDELAKKNNIVRVLKTERSDC